MIVRTRPMSVQDPTMPSKSHGPLEVIRAMAIIPCIAWATMASADPVDAPTEASVPAEPEVAAEAPVNANAAAESTSRPPRPTAPPNVSVYPQSISLSHARDFQRVVAVLNRDDGITSEVTDRATLAIADPKIAAIDGGVVRPVANGETSLVLSYAGATVRLPINVTDASVDPPISFTADVMPVLTRGGCNTGSCHGASRGKDGFRLSLFGFDPAGDYQRITREIGVRRINLALPQESLLLEKAIGAVPHTGGKLFEADSDLYRTLHRWLVEGAKMDAADKMPSEVTSLKLYPTQAVIEGHGNTQQLVAVATMADGTTRDVTDLAAYTTNNSSTGAITTDGLVTAGQRGEAFVTARFGTHTVGSQILVLPENLQYAPPKVEGNYIDQLVGQKLQKLRITPSPMCTDQEFIRRVTIDIIGQLPTPDEVEAFIADPAQDKRAAVVDRLLERKEFSEIWAMKFAQLLMIKSSNQVSYKSAYLYSTWLTDNFAREVPIDKMVRELLTASGGTFGVPQTNFYEIERDTLKTSENVAQVFMGIRTQCAQCHNHPFDRWTMDDYYGFASFFTQIGRKGAEDYREQIIYDRRGGEFNHPVTGKPIPPTFLGGDTPETKGKDRREVLANWLTGADNPFFSTSIANRVWAHFMGVGNVHPVDDIRVSNPPSNPELFEELGERLVQYDFNFKQLVRDICNSNAYGRSAQTNESNQHDSRNYAHATIRRIPAESLSDCICQITEQPEKFRGLPLGARATQIADGRTSTYFLNTFGRSPRTTVCECEATTEPSLSQALHLLNGQSIHNKIERSGQIKQWVTKDKLSPREIVEQIYFRALTRKPTEKELSQLLAEFDGFEKDDQRIAALNDIYWAVLNSREFVFNH